MFNKALALGSAFSKSVRAFQQVGRPYSHSVSRYDAFEYYDKHPQIDQSRLHYVNAHREACTLVNKKMDETFRTAKSLFEIRLLYDPRASEDEQYHDLLAANGISLERGEECQAHARELKTFIQQVATKASGGDLEKQKELDSAFRSILKGCARNRMSDYSDGRERLEEIHKEENKRHGDIMGADPQKLISGLTPEQVRAKTERKRAPTELLKNLAEKSPDDSAVNDTQENSKPKI